MQLYAYDLKKNFIFSSNAYKHTDYFCLECSQKVRLRKGLHRRAHFYHLHPNTHCRQDGKGLIHIALQHHIQSLFPPSTIKLEHRFPTINRIADILWEEKKIIFEIQCSPITANEIQNRNSDYASLGYQVVWILHDNRYNNTRLTEAEMFLQASPHYYTNINEHGIGTIYDQLALIKEGKRINRLPKLPIDITSPQNTPPHPLPTRQNNWPLYFQGDTTDLSPLYINQLSTWNTQQQSLPSFLHQYIIHPYKALLYFLVERSCR